MNIDGYDLVSFFTRSDYQHGGSMIYVKHDVKYSVTGLDCSRYARQLIFECSAILLKIDKCKYCIISVYRPPSGNLDTFFDVANDFLRFCMEKNSNIVFCGDLNINFLQDSNEKRLLLDFFNNFNLSETSLEPTRIYINKNSRTSSSKIDYLAVNHSHESKTVIVQPNIGDHLATVHTFKIPLITKQSDIPYQNRDLSEHNLNLLKHCLTLMPLDRLYELDKDVNVIYNEILNMILWAVETNCPIREKKRKNSNKKEWLTPEIIHNGTELKKLFWLARNTGDVQVFDLYKDKKRKHKQTIVNAKKENNVKILMNSDNRQKTLWSMVNPNLGRNKNLQKIELGTNNIIISEPSQVATIFADYFETITEKSLENKFGLNRSKNCTLSRNTLINSFFLNPVEKSEIINIITKMKNKNSTGVDCISIKIIKSIKEIIVEPLQYLTEIMFETGKFPTDLKTGVVVPIHKKLDPTDASNYRPITILNVLAKILERILYNKLTSFLNKYAIITDCQHGFCAGRSTESAAADLMEFIYKKLDDGDYVAGLFFDLSRAFDSLDHNFLIHKLQRYGIRGNSLQLIESYLEGRKFLVRVSDCTSELKDIDTGVPQGSVLGPLLFILFVNDMPEHVFGSTKIMFADDTSMVVSAGSPEELKQKVGSIVSDFGNWCNTNKLILNIEKTVFVNFRASKSKPLVELVDLTVSTEVKFLGIYIDENINWLSHINYVCNKLSQGYFALTRLKHEFDKKNVLNIYYSLAYSHLTYNVILWGNSVHAQRVFIAQKRIIRIMFGLNYGESCRPVFLSRQIMTFPCIYVFKTILFIKRHLNKIDNNSTFHNYNTRNARALSMDSHKLSKFEKSPLYSGKKLYNKLPKSVQLLKETAFKSAVKNILIKGSFYSVQEFLSAAL